MELHELFPAIQAAEKAVSLNPHWFVVHQTLGRAQMGFGDTEMVSTLYMPAEIFFKSWVSKTVIFFAVTFYFSQSSGAHHFLSQLLKD